VLQRPTKGHLEIEKGRLPAHLGDRHEAGGYLLKSEFVVKVASPSARDSSSAHDCQAIALSDEIAPFKPWLHQP
jgi:hypothetical protein